MEEEKQKDFIDTVVDQIKHLPGAPTREVINDWKNKHRNVQVFILSGDDVFIFRSITRSEYRKIQSLPEAIRKEIPNITDEDLDDKFKDAVCKTAILFPENIDQQLETLGGLSGLLVEQIYFASCLVPPEVAMSSIRKM